MREAEKAAKHEDANVLAFSPERERERVDYKRDVGDMQEWEI